LDAKTMRKVVKVGIISREDYRKRTIAIARGEYTPRKSEPKIWFESLRSMAQVLGSKNQELLLIIMENNPRSLAELEQLTGRKKANLGRESLYKALAPGSKPRFDTVLKVMRSLGVHLEARVEAGMC